MGQLKAAFKMASSRISSLHGNVKHRSRTAILLVDVINSFDYPKAAQLLEPAQKAAKQIRLMKRRARGHGIPVIYANDNYGRWRSNLKQLVELCLKGRGKAIINAICPASNDYFVIKPKNSAFYTTSLDLLLKSMGARTIVLCGFTTDNCVLFTGNDAYLRDYRLVVPEDCVASFDREKNERALSQMREILKADIRPWRKTDIFARNRPGAH